MLLCLTESYLDSYNATEENFKNGMFELFSIDFDKFCYGTVMCVYMAGYGSSPVMKQGILIFAGDKVSLIPNDVDAVQYGYIRLGFINGIIEICETRKYYNY